MVMVLVGHAAPEEDGEWQAEGLACLHFWPWGFPLLSSLFLMGLKKEIAFSRGTLYSLALKRILYVVFINTGEFIIYKGTVV